MSNRRDGKDGNDKKGRRGEVEHLKGRAQKVGLEKGGGLGMKGYEEWESVKSVSNNSTLRYLREGSRTKQVV